MKLIEGCWNTSSMEEKGMENGGLNVKSVIEAKEVCEVMEECWVKG